MSALLRRTGAVARRVLLQLSRDRRFIVLSLMAPLAIIYVLYIFFDSLTTTPLFDATVYVVPFGALIIHFITFILTAIVLVRERTTGTLERMFVNGYLQVDIILGYLLAYSSLATVQSLLVLTELNVLFELDYTLGVMASIYLVMWFLAVISMALGIFISSFARNEGQVFPFIPLIVLPSIFVSGLILPVDRLPEWAQYLSYITPLYYANDVLQSLIGGGVLSDDWLALARLPIYGLVVLLLAVFTLRERD